MPPRKIVRKDSTSPETRQKNKVANYMKNLYDIYTKDTRINYDDEQDVIDKYSQMHSQKMYNDQEKLLKNAIPVQKTEMQELIDLMNKNQPQTLKKKKQKKYESSEESESEEEEEQEEVVVQKKKPKTVKKKVQKEQQEKIPFEQALKQNMQMLKQDKMFLEM